MCNSFGSAWPSGINHSKQHPSQQLSSSCHMWRCPIWVTEASLHDPMQQKGYALQPGLMHRAASSQWPQHADLRRSLDGLPVCWARKDKQVHWDPGQKPTILIGAAGRGRPLAHLLSYKGHLPAFVSRNATSSIQPWQHQHLLPSSGKARLFCQDAPPTTSALFNMAQLGSVSQALAHSCTCSSSAAPSQGQSRPRLRGCSAAGRVSASRGSTQVTFLAVHHLRLC